MPVAFPGRLHCQRREIAGPNNIVIAHCEIPRSGRCRNTARVRQRVKARREPCWAAVNATIVHDRALRGLLSSLSPCLASSVFWLSLSPCFNFRIDVPRFSSIDARAASRHGRQRPARSPVPPARRPVGPGRPAAAGCAGPRLAAVQEVGPHHATLGACGLCAALPHLLRACGLPPSADTLSGQSGP